MKLITLKTLAICLYFGLYVSKTFAQESISKPQAPIPIEIFGTTNGLQSQFIISKQFKKLPKLGFFNVSTFYAEYGNNIPQQQYLSQSLLTYDLFVKGFAVNAGATLNYKTGFRPTAGIQYIFGSREWLLVALPRMDLTENFNWEVFGLLEYKPMLNNKLGVYSRIQALLNRSTTPNFHERSYIYGRLGLSLAGFQFGLGYNIDYYGPKEINENSFGLFLRTELY